MLKICFINLSLLMMLFIWRPLIVFGQSEVAKSLAWSISTELVEDLNGEISNQELIDDSRIIIEVNLPKSQEFGHTSEIIKNWRLKHPDIEVQRDWSIDESDYVFHSSILYLKGSRENTMRASIWIDFCDPRRWNCEGEEGMYKLRFSINDMTI